MWHRSLWSLVAVCVVVLAISLQVHGGSAPASAGASAGEGSTTASASTATGSTTPPTSEPTTTTTTPSSTPTGQATASVPECRPAHLRASYRARDAATGHVFGVVRLRNTGRHACLVQGYGGLSYLTQDGRQVGAAATRDPGATPRVVLRHGQRAVSTVSEARADFYPRSRCRPTHVSALQVYAPDTRRALLVPHATTGCRASSVHLISHGAYHR